MPLTLIRSGNAALLVQGFRRYRILMAMYRQDPGGWRRRLLRERAVFLVAIGDLLLDEKWDALPPAWQLLSPPLAAVLTQALLGSDHCRSS